MPVARWTASRTSPWSTHWLVEVAQPVISAEEMFDQLD
jgi:hypothetical protein